MRANLETIKQLKTRPNMTRGTIRPTSAQDLRFRRVFVNETPEMTTFGGGGGTQFFGGWGAKGAQLRGSHVSTCWNPEVSFSLRYGVSRFGAYVSDRHHISERSVSTFHVSAAAKESQKDSNFAFSKVSA